MKENGTSAKRSENKEKKERERERLKDRAALKTVFRIVTA